MVSTRIAIRRKTLLTAALVASATMLIVPWSARGETAATADDVDVQSFQDANAPDWTEAFVRALASAKRVRVPGNRVYPIHSGRVVLKDGQRLVGDGAVNGGSVLRALDQTGDLVTLENNAELSGFYIDTADRSGQSGGCLVRATTTGTGRARVTDLQMWNAWNGLCIEADTVSATGLKFFSTHNDDVDIAGGYNLLLDDLFSQADPEHQPRSCIHISQSGDVTIRGARLLYCGEAVLADVADRKYISSLLISDSFLDTSRRALHIRSAGSGNIVRARFNDVWFGNSAQEGVLIENRGSGRISDLQFLGSTIQFNKGEGFRTQGSIDALTLDNPTIVGNGHGTGGPFAGLHFGPGVVAIITNPLIGGTTEAPNDGLSLVADLGAGGVVLGGRIDAQDGRLHDNTGPNGLRFIAVNGVRTSAWLQASLPAGATSLRIPHGLAFPLRRGEWILSLDGSAEAAGVGSCWAENAPPDALLVRCDRPALHPLALTLAISSAKGRSP